MLPYSLCPPYSILKAEMARRNSIFQNFILLFLLLITKSLLLEAKLSNSSAISCIKMEREALLKFKEDLIDPSGWLSSWVGDDCCNWVGVGCSNVTGNVFSIDLRAQDDCDAFQENEAAPYKKSCLSGTLNPSLLNLTYLNYLDLSYNSFQGTPIPEFIGSLKNLRYIDLAQAYFTGEVPSSLGNLSNLQYLNLTTNKFFTTLWVSDLNWLSALSSLQYLGLEGVNLPEATTNWLQVVNKLPSLRELKLSRCNLRNFPHSLPFVNLTSLSVLDLSFNMFEGTPIPEYIGSLKNLKYLDLSLALFTGMVPPSIGNLSNLLYLDLKTNSFLGKLWVSDLKWVSGLSSLQYLRLEGMDLSKATYWLKAINMLPSLMDLRLTNCELNSFYQSLPVFNFTSLSLLDLSDNNFSSPIPKWLFNISSLATVQLYGCELSGPIPGVPRGNMCNLSNLDISDNAISGDIEEFIEGLSVCNNSSLKNLDLSSNKLGGNLPDSLGYFKYLEFLKLSNNSFLGSLPTSIGNLSLLGTLDLSFNMMSGTISESIGQLTELYSLDLYGNSWKGVITENHLQNLTRLVRLSLSSTGNALAFNVRPNWIAPFSLLFIQISGCQFFPAFPSWLKTQVALSELILSNVSISDTIPDWFWRLIPQIWWLDLSHNQLRGKLPNRINAGPETWIDLGFNLLEGSVPLWSNVTNLSLRNNFLTGPIPLNIGHKMSRLKILDLSRNLLNGSIPPSMSEMQNLSSLDLSNNSLSGEIPSNWQGLKDLVILDLSNNRLSGDIPSCTCSLHSLVWLKLSSNNLSGELSTSLRNCTRLSALDLGENRFFGNISIAENIFFLSYLRLRDNMLTGKIPEQLCRFPSLHILDLAHNNLSGSIPRCLGNLRAFKYESTLLKFPPLSWQTSTLQHVELVLKGREDEYTKIIPLINLIDLSGNNLMGEIPKEITNLSYLGTLNLSSNLLRGKIPENIGSLQWLESLDLSCNRLSGTIPSSMTSMTFLSHLNLSYNNLSGPIPSTNQFQSLVDPSIYEGNPYLCGPPLTTDCSSGQRDVEDKDEEVKDEDESEKLWFYISMGLGFVVGFWAVCGTLAIKKSWRHAYFRFVEEMKDELLVIIAICVARSLKKMLNDREVKEVTGEKEA